MIGPALQAIGLFLVTNIDDIIVLSLFFARGAGQRGTTTRNNDSRLPIPQL